VISNVFVLERERRAVRDAEVGAVSTIADFENETVGVASRREYPDATDPP
jgi:hypothetical protein